MDEKTTNELDRLLADGELSGPEADAIFDRVHASLAAAERPRRPVQALVLGSSFAAAALVLLLVVRANQNPNLVGELSARGTVSRATALEATCSQGTLSACPISGKLVFLVANGAPPGFLSAYAEPLDPGAERVWYFSRDSGSPELTSAGDGTHVFDRAVSLAGSHRPGRYRVHAFFATRPLSRDEMLAGRPSVSMLNSIQIDVTITAAK